MQALTSLTCAYDLVIYHAISEFTQGQSLNKQLINSFYINLLTLCLVILI